MANEPYDRVYKSGQCSACGWVTQWWDNERSNHVPPCQSCGKNDTLRGANLTGKEAGKQHAAMLDRENEEKRERLYRQWANGFRDWGDAPAPASGDTIKIRRPSKIEARQAAHDPRVLLLLTKGE